MRDSRKHVKTFLHYAFSKEYEGYYYVIFFLLLLSTSLSFFVPALSSMIIDALAGNGSAGLSRVIVATIIILLLAACVSLLNNYFVSKFKTQSSLLMQKDVLNDLLVKKPLLFRKYKQGEILFRLYNDTSLIAEKFLLLPANLIVSVVFIAIAFFTLSSVNPIISAFVAGMFLVNTLVNSILQKRGKTHSRDNQEKGEHLYALSQEQLKCISSIQLACTIEVESQKNNKLVGSLANSSFRRAFYFGNSAIGLQLLNSVWTVGIILIGGISINSSTMTLGDLVYCLTLTNLISPFFGSIQELILYGSSYAVIMSRYQEILDYDRFDFFSGDELCKREVAGTAIRIERLSFVYENSDLKVLENFSELIPANKLTCVIGKSGVGKSTLLKLISRVEEPTSGRIVMAHKDISAVSLKSLRNCIAYVGSDSQLFSGSLIDNITYGCDSWTTEELDRAIEMAQLNGVLRNLPDGIHTQLSSEKASLSEGEKQRVLLARGLLSRKPILLLDEVTANVDLSTESLIYSNLRALLSTTTIISVSHRKEVLQFADKIIDLDCENDSLEEVV